jgi:hypothetical protein
MAAILCGAHRAGLYDAALSAVNLYEAVERELSKRRVTPQK